MFDLLKVQCTLDIKQILLKKKKELNSQLNECVDKLVRSQFLCRFRFVLYPDLVTIVYVAVQ